MHGIVGLFWSGITIYTIRSSATDGKQGTMLNHAFGHPRRHFWLTAAILTGLASPGFSNDGLTASPNSLTTESARILAPTLGRPALIKPGESFLIGLRIPATVDVSEYKLAAPHEPLLSYPLEICSDAPVHLSGDHVIRVTVPANVPARTYDLVITAADSRLSSMHSVAVGNFEKRLRIVHLSNMNVGDVGAPTPDPRLVHEVNLVAPDLIVATGDYVDVTHPEPETAWRELLAMFRAFDAPVVMACGDHDSVEMYSNHVAPSPVGMIEFGRFRGLILYDLPRAPIIEDVEQLAWLEKRLVLPDPERITFIVTHDDTPNLLYYWQRQGLLNEQLRSGRIGLWFTGGHRDWEGRDYREIIAAAEPLLYVRTHQSSAAPRGGASGTPHYRVIDIVDGQARFPQTDSQSIDAPPSIPLGLLYAYADGPNDGSRSTMSICVTNNHAFRLTDLSYTVRLRKIPGHAPWIQGGRFATVIDCGEYWECRAKFDLPDKGGTRIQCGSGPIGVAHEMSVVFDVPEPMSFIRQTTVYGLPYYRSLTPAPRIRITNGGRLAKFLSPLIRLDGDLLAYRPISEAEHYATAYRFLLNPGESIELEVDASAIRVIPGRRDLQVYPEGAVPGIVYSHTVQISEAK